ncbi:MAG: PEP-CTERM sorting domain-containing protein [Armatimonadetes bacterium]|nr:PEP-CTERM sorting domain-containing protein [Armatimonadota bacterium]
MGKTLAGIHSNIVVDVVPEPATFLALGVGLAALVVPSTEISRIARL